MKTVMVIIMALLLSAGTTFACTAVNKERAKRGVNEGFQGECSNNGYKVTCILLEGSWVKCTGPSGGYTGTSLSSLIASACSCVISDLGGGPR